MRRYLYLLSPLLIVLSVSYAVGQTVSDVVAAPDANMGQYLLKIFLTALTLGGSAATPYLTKYLTMGVLIAIGKAKVNVPAPVLNIISTVISGVYAGVMGMETDLPLNGDTALLVGGIVGGGSQHFANNAPVKPSPEAMAKVVKQEPTAIV